MVWQGLTVIVIIVGIPIVVAIVVGGRQPRRAGARESAGRTKEPAAAETSPGAGDPPAPPGGTSD